MTDTTTKRLWFMDWHGWVLDHNLARDFFSRHPFQPGSYPGLSIIVPSDFTLPTEVTFKKQISMPRAFPLLTMGDAGENLVFFKNEKTNTYMSSSPHEKSREITLDSPNCAGWEYFLPLSENLLRGISSLLVPSALTIVDSASQSVLSTLKIHDGFIGQLSETSFALNENLEALEKIGSLPAGSSTEITFLKHQSHEPWILNISRPLA
ncbi:hypothetical protein [Swingsia samuiensis]|uniref:Uncharacterized protein n=1 Tax=Swingsia samuiensis TaxID=1293412 RepID=A0A4Y6UJC5_9PROT|nr:hypothetical protein [Swingsia samuiensis]QDH16920.1 hypothetical protein E3D00_04580 [Swingsia samuiensis]